MKIGIDARMYSPAFTGIGRYVYDLVHGLAKLKAEHEYVIFMNEPEFSKFQAPDSRFRAVLVNAKHYSLAEQWRFWRTLRREKLDLMHFTHFNAPILYRRPSVVTIHDLTISLYHGKKFRSRIYRLGYHLVLHSVLKHAKKIIAVSRHTKSDLVRLCKIAPKKVTVTYLGVGSSFKAGIAATDALDLCQRYGVSKPYFLYTGVWRDHKNLLRMVEAFSKIKNTGLTAQLVITGKEDPFYPELKAKVAELGLQKDVIFTGLVPEEDLVLLYQAARAYVFPSLYEGFGLPPLEAMRCGIPVAASTSSCIPEICGEGNALFFDPLNVEEMADAMQKVFSDEALRTELIKNGLEHSRTFSWDSLVKETAKVYEELVS